MSKFKQHMNIEGFSIENIDTSEMEDIIDWLPKNGVFDLNIAEEGLIRSLHAEGLCQDVIIKIEKYIGLKESEKATAWAEAALDKAKIAGHKTAKDKEWYAASDQKYINIQNEITIAKAAKRWFESKADNFRNWHYAFKTFLKRDYSLEKLGNTQDLGYNYVATNKKVIIEDEPDIGGEIDW